MNIQDKYYILDLLFKRSLLIGNLYSKEKEYWDDLKKWLEKKEFFGKWGYDFENKTFLKEPEDPSQQKLFKEA